VVNYVTASQSYALQDLLNQKNFNAHVTQLKQFVFDETDADVPLRAAMNAQQEFIVEALLAHDGTYRDRKAELDVLGPLARISRPGLMGTLQESPGHG
jgi:hypothetical protein